MEARTRFYRALGAYAVLGVIAWFRLEAELRAGILLLLGALTALTWIHSRRQE